MFEVREGVEFTGELRIGDLGGRFDNFVLILEGIQCTLGCSNISICELQLITGSFGPAGCWVLPKNCREVNYCVGQVSTSIGRKPWGE